MENTIHFAVGFKSYDLARLSGTAGDWYDWTERSRTTTHFTKKTMMWILQRLKEASLSKGNSVRRWKMREDFSETFCARNLNKYGRYISIINLKGKRRSVLIIPELTLNSGWTFVAEKVDRFIKSQKNELPTMEHRLTDKNIPYSEALRSSKWSSRDKSFINADSMLKNTGGGINDVDVASTFMKEGGRICNNDDSFLQNEVLKRSLVGKFENRVNVPLTLAEIRRWSSNIWKQSHGLSIYEMGNEMYNSKSGPNKEKIVLRTTADENERGVYSIKEPTLSSLISYPDWVKNVIMLVYPILLSCRNKADSPLETQ